MNEFAINELTYWLMYNIAINNVAVNIFNILYLGFILL